MGFARCAAKLQSPIDISAQRMPSDAATQSATNVMAVDFSKTLFFGGNQDILNLTVAPNPLKPNRILWAETGDENSNRTQYVLDRVEFHHPAEHLINGQRFALEIQFHLRSNQGELMSVAVLGRVAPPQFVSLDLLAFTRDLLPIIPEFNGSVNLADVDPSIFLPRLEGFWSYSGTYTSPPCTENVRWVIMHYPVNVTRGFLDSMAQLVNIRYPGGNARPVQNRDLGFQSQLFKKALVGGELLFTNSIALTGAQINRTRITRRVDWPSEPSVVDIAKQWSRVHPSSGDAEQGDNAPKFDLGDEWQFLSEGRPRSFGGESKKSAFDSLPMSAVANSMYEGMYVITDKCGYVEDPMVACMRANSTSSGGCNKSMNPKLIPPENPPGVELLRNSLKANDAAYQSTTFGLRGVVEQAVQATDASIMHILPDDNEMNK